ncbi:CACTA en-spm transposon protein [Cucumis melo var. makuwa]|uniref:CACTA en-spm transposon protein n=1 Tax=Cucumis melo var. makuwa TaxID=1194695 RepID=A0A5D3BNY2_CUCMM|nr:CACTA en-spm transposon protein [Cucumis melo var. makuwa]TYK00462.1 CACTA en-spm transposon protein [Cucumis melo var. makuwa]
MFLEFIDDLDNLMGGLSSVGDNPRLSSQPSATLTLRRRCAVSTLRVEHYVAANGRIPMTIALGAIKPICPHAIRFSQVIDVFFKHQMLITFKEFRGDCHRPFKKYSDLKEAHANPPHLLAKLDRAMQQIEEQTRNHEALVSEVKRMQKLIEDMTRAQQGSPHDDP